MRDEGGRESSPSSVVRDEEAAESTKSPSCHDNPRLRSGSQASRRSVPADVAVRSVDAGDDSSESSRPQSRPPPALLLPRKLPMPLSNGVRMVHSLRSDD